MKASISQTLQRHLPGPLTLQALIALCVLLFALSPATGGTALYLPFGPDTSARTVAWSRAHGANLVAPGPYSGAFFLQIPSGNLTGAALSNGALLISVPEFLCGSKPPRETGSKKMAIQT